MLTQAGLRQQQLNMNISAWSREPACSHPILGLQAIAQTSSWYTFEHQIPQAVDFPQVQPSSYISYKPPKEGQPLNKGQTCRLPPMGAVAVSQFE